MKNRLSFVVGLCLAGWNGFASPQTVVAKAPENELTESEKRSGWQLLFDGETTSGWRNYGKSSINDGWTIKDGALVRKEKGAGDIITEKKYDAFELSLEYRISPGGNSGVMFHVQETDGPPWHTGPEIQIQDNEGGHDPQKAGWLYQLYKPDVPRWAKDTGEVLDATRPAGEWNQLYIRIEKGQSEVVMNGLRYYRFQLGSDDWKKKVSESKFADLPNFGQAGDGHICLQDHGNLVAFRNIKIRELGDDGSVPLPIDGTLELQGELAFPSLKWDGWEPVDDAGRARELRLMELTPSRDGTNRLFAVSQDGAIFVFENKPDVEESHLFLDLRDSVIDFKGGGANEQGLLGLALHPDFKTNGQFFVYYSHLDDKRSIISRFRVSADDPNRADPDSEEVLLEIPQPYKNHNGGSIEFGPDGFLYIGLGDGGDRNDPHAHGQDPSTLLGSILRIDVDSAAEGKKYGIPRDNPFVGVEGMRPEVYAYGLRNVWRLAFDSKTGRLWCGDVGQELWEEINVIERGGNYGWSIREGNHPFGNRPADPPSAPIDPVWEYDHQIGKSITGGRVYRSSRLSELEGKYLYADYVTGRIWALGYDPETGKVTENLLVGTGQTPVTAFGEDENGEVYYMTISGRGDCIYRFER